MTTVSKLLDSIVSATNAREPAAEGVRNSGDECGLWVRPNEDVYFWVRSVDNSRVSSQAELLPTTCNVDAGIDDLRLEREILHGHQLEESVRELTHA